MPEEAVWPGVSRKVAASFERGMHSSNTPTLYVAANRQSISAQAYSRVSGRQNASVNRLAGAYHDCRACQESAKCARMASDAALLQITCGAEATNGVPMLDIKDVKAGAARRP